MSTRVVLGYGPQPINFFVEAARLLSTAAAVDTDVARMAGATFAVGEPEALAELRKRLEPGALERAALDCATSFGRLPEGLSPGAIKWMAVGERGASSEALFTWLSGVNITRGSMDGVAHTDHPRDPADFRRCRLMLEACPELAAQLNEAAGMSLEWSVLIQLWGTICDTMDAEAPDWREATSQPAPNTYQLIKMAIGR